MELPAHFINSLNGITGFDKEAFTRVHSVPEALTSVRINPAKIKNSESIFPKTSQSAIPWTSLGFYLSTRPSFTFDPLFHAGTYYVQEASSMFLEQALLQTVDVGKPLKVLDLCAAPGGKSTHIQSLISSESLLVSNEVIKGRNNVLVDNITKWGSNNVVVTQSDPKLIGAIKNYFDVIVADAPCSGSGLFRRDEDAIQEWSLNNVQLCCQRQQRILADVMPALKEGGLLIYSTCSYSQEENEDILDWLVEEFGVESLPLQIDDKWGIVETRSLKHLAVGYRFFPDKVKGEGFFISCLTKRNEASDQKQKTTTKPDLVSRKESELVSSWISKGDHEFIKYREDIYLIPASLTDEVARLLTILYVTSPGTLIGNIVHDKMIPAHGLAMSTLVASHIPCVELSLDHAIEYLQKKIPDIAIKNKGWQLVTFQGHALGWINALSNRFNNYYPKSLRILKDR